MSAHLKLVPGPYSLGYNGHARSCDCPACAASRAEDIAARARGYGIKGKELSLGTVPVKSYTVRAHMRKQRGHLSHLPRTKRELLKLLRKESK